MFQWISLMTIFLFTISLCDLLACDKYTIYCFFCFFAESAFWIIWSSFNSGLNCVSLNRLLLNSQNLFLMIQVLFNVPVVRHCQILSLCTFPLICCTNWPHAFSWHYYYLQTAEIRCCMKCLQLSEWINEYKTT